MEPVKNREPDKGDGIKTHIASLPYVTGRNRFNGHRIYGASRFFMNGDYGIFLADDRHHFGNVHALPHALCKKPSSPRIA